MLSASLNAYTMALYTKLQSRNEVAFLTRNNLITVLISGVCGQKSSQSLNCPELATSGAIPALAGIENATSHIFISGREGCLGSEWLFASQKCSLLHACFNE